MRSAVGLPVRNAVGLSVQRAEDGLTELQQLAHAL